jgi:hypothetical protein
LIAKTIPVYKNKGDKSNSSNYRTIANLCSTSKIFEKLILKTELEIQNKAGVDFTGANQHVFERKCSTGTLTLKLQSQLVRALNDASYAMAASLTLDQHSTLSTLTYL